MAGYHPKTTIMLFIIGFRLTYTSDLRQISLINIPLHTVNQTRTNIDDVVECMVRHSVLSLGSHNIGF